MAERHLGKMEVASSILASGSDCIFSCDQLQYDFNMAQSKFSENLVKLKCSACKRVTYYVHKNVKKVEGKLALAKYCKWCKKHTSHKESKK